MNQKQITNYFKITFNENLVKVVDCSSGLDQVVKKVITNKSDYIVKVAKKVSAKNLIARENYVCEKMKINKYFPKIIFHKKEFIIQTCILGQSLQAKKLSTKKEITIYYDLGKAINKLHQVKLEGYGELLNNGNGKFKNLINYVKSLVVTDNVIRDYLLDNAYIFDDDETVLLHGDLTDGNIMVNRNEFSGIIDFGDACAGFKEYDLAKIYIEKPKSVFDSFVKGYGLRNLNRGKLNYMVVVHLLYLIPYYKSLEMDKSVRRLNRILGSCVNVIK